MEEKHEKRSEKRILAFCKVLDSEQEFIGVTTDLTSTGVSLSLPNVFPTELPFSVTLRREDADLQVFMRVKPIWRQRRNETHDDIGGQIVSVESQASFDALLTYCQQHDPDGLLTPEQKSTAH